MAPGRMLAEGPLLQQAGLMPVRRSTRARLAATAQLSSTSLLAGLWHVRLNHCRASGQSLSIALGCLTVAWLGGSRHELDLQHSLPHAWCSSRQAGPGVAGVKNTITQH